MHGSQTDLYTSYRARALVLSLRTPFHTPLIPKQPPISGAWGGEVAEKSSLFLLLIKTE
ncbi:hypothetical protein ES708_17905 [subsurface metagenome]